MRAILITSGELKEISISGDSISSSLMLLIDRPFIQHVIEYLVNQGIKDFDVVLCQSPEKIKDLLGNGRRWGVNFTYHLVRDPARPYEILKRISSEPKGPPVILAHTDRLLLADISSSIQNKPLPVLYFQNHDEWTGWAVVPHDSGKELPKDSDEKDLLTYLLSFPNCGKILLDAPILNAQSHKDLLLAHGAVIEKKFNNLMITGREVEDNVWVSRNVSIHPSAKITPPVYIGENCNIEKNVSLGPGVVVGKDCFINRESILENTVIFPGSYVGEALELRDVLVNRNHLVNVRLGTELTISEDLILGSLTKKPLVVWWKKLFSRIIAFNLILLTSPFFLIITFFLKFFRKGNVFHAKEAICLPAEPDMSLWRTFSLLSFSRPEAVQKAGLNDLFLRFLPGLINIAQGNLHFVGVKPRTSEEINALPREWKLLYLKSKPGLISEALVNFGPEPDEDELFSAETFYSVSAGLKYDLKILVKYLGQITGFVPLPGDE
ncbi:sugar transferase [Desulfobacterales bacterium HSG17]|nr:sugar transferase [Desulfobacterales bacterium HSG17]